MGREYKSVNDLFSMMESIENQMKRLWKNTFHDSDEYINLIFDSYFEPDMVEYELDDNGEVVAAMLGVEYEFGRNVMQSEVSRSGSILRKTMGDGCMAGKIEPIMNINTIKTVYLCGLVTGEKYRRCGIMTILIERMAAKMKKRGFAFLFLIPASNYLVKYYEGRGFIKAFYRKCENFTSVHDFTRDFFKLTKTDSEEEKMLKINRYEMLEVKNIAFVPANENELDHIIDYIYLVEKFSNFDLALFQSKKQIRVFIKEAILSGGSIWIVRENASEEILTAGVTAVEDGVVKILKIFGSDDAARYKLMASVKEAFPAMSMEIYRNELESEGPNIWEPEYADVFSEATSVGAVGEIERVYDDTKRLQLYGMMRILDLSEILKFATCPKSNFKYSILTHQENEGYMCRYSAENGVLKIETDLKDSGNEPVMDDRQIGALIFRKCNGPDDEVMTAFGLPRLTSEIFLMLD